jgi:hypothetical protein
VSWCPLGFNNRPVSGLSLTAGNWQAGWVVVPRAHFGWSSVRQWAIEPQQLPATTPFVVQARAPIPPMRAVPHPDVMAALPAAGVAIPRAAAGVGSQQFPAIIRQPAAGVGRQQSPSGRERSKAGSQLLPDRSRLPAVPPPPTSQRAMSA